MAALASDWLGHFRLLLWNRWTEFNKTWQEARSQRPLPSLCFPGPSEKQDGRPGLWLAETFLTNETWHETRSQRPLLSLCFSGRLEKQDGCPGLWLAETFQLLLLNRWMEFNKTWQEARSQCPLPSLCFLGRSEKQDGHPGLWLAETFSNSPLKLLNGIQRNLTESKISTSSTKCPCPKGELWPWPKVILSRSMLRGTLTKIPYPGHNFLLSCSIWMIFHTMVVHDPKMWLTLNQGPISRFKITLHT